MMGVCAALAIFLFDTITMCLNALSVCVAVDGVQHGHVEPRGFGDLHRRFHPGSHALPRGAHSALAPTHALDIRPYHVTQVEINPNNALYVAEIDNPYMNGSMAAHSTPISQTHPGVRCRHRQVQHDGALPSVGHQAQRAGGARGSRLERLSLGAWVFLCLRQQR